MQAETEDTVLAPVLDEIADAAPPVLAEVRARVMAAQFPALQPAERRGERQSSGLRAHLASSTVWRRFRATVRFVVADPNGMKMARYTNALPGATRWRHPVFGNTERWVQQKADPWFYPPLNEAIPRFRAAAERGVDALVRRLNG